MSVPLVFILMELWNKERYKQTYHHFAKVEYSQTDKGYEKTSIWERGLSLKSVAKIPGYALDWEEL